MSLNCRQLHDYLALPLVPIVQDIGLRGMPFSTERRDQLVLQIGTKLAIHEQALANEGIEHLSSSQALSRVLEAKGLPLTKMTDKKTQFKTDLDVLRRIDHHYNKCTPEPTFPWLPWLIEWKKLDKASKNCISLVPCDDGMIRTSLRTDTKTARYRSSAFRKTKAKGWCPQCERFDYHGANLQNLAKDDEETGVSIKSVFVPRPGWMLGEIDMRLFELFVMALRCGCDLLMERMLDKNLDLHTLHAHLLFGQDTEITKNRRTLAKNFFYALRGGGGEVAIQIALAKKGEFLEQSVISQHMRAIFGEYPEIPAWNIATDVELKRQEKTIGEYRLVRNAFGRPRVLLANQPLKEALATEISGTAADIMNFAILRLAYEYPAVVDYICMQIHDSIVVHAPKTLFYRVMFTIKQALERPVWLPPEWGDRMFPFQADAKGSEESWAGMREIELKEAA